MPVLCGVIPFSPEELRDQFEKFVKKGPDCWLWCGPTWPNGYGYVRYTDNHKQKKVSAGRLACALYTGVWPKETEQTQRTCSTIDCVNPAHLVVVDYFDREFFLKMSCRKNRRVNLKLTENQVRDIRAQFRARVSQKSLCQQYSLTSATLSKICNYKTWAHLGDKPWV